MKQIWYVHKWHHFDYRGYIRVPHNYDHADKLAARLARRYGGLGWSYEITSSAANPEGFVCAGEGI